MKIVFKLERAAPASLHQEWAWRDSTTCSTRSTENWITRSRLFCSSFSSSSNEFSLTAKVQIYGIHHHSRRRLCCCCCRRDGSKFFKLYYMLFHCLIEFQFFFSLSSISNWDFNYTLKALNHQLLRWEDLSLFLSFTSFIGWSIWKKVWFSSVLVDS